MTKLIFKKWNAIGRMPKGAEGRTAIEDLEIFMVKSRKCSVVSRNFPASERIHTWLIFTLD